MKIISVLLMSMLLSFSSLSFAQESKEPSKDSVPSVNQNKESSQEKECDLVTDPFCG